MARATAKTWCNLIAGLVAGALVLPAPARAAEDRQVAQLQGRAGTRAALNSGVEAQRRGDYEMAAASFQYAFNRQEDLTPEERQELARLMRDNTQALQARRDGTEALHRAEQALQQGKSADAAELVKKAAAAEQYLAAPEKARLQQMGTQLRVRTTLAPAAANAASTQARVRVQQARAAISQGNWDAAESLAREAEQSGAGFGRGEDSPRRVLEDVEAMRRDPKALMQAARLCLARRDYDRAERLARQAEQAGSGWSMPWSDSPAKVLKEIQAARAQARPAPEGPPRVADPRGPASPPAGHPSGITLTSATAPAPPSPPPVNAADTEKARALLQQGRDALGRGDLAQARKCAEMARALRANLHWSDDHPEKLLADVARADARRTNAAAAGGSVPRTKEEAQALLDKGRQQLAEGKLDEATQSCLKAKAFAGGHWGLFEDTPDSLLSDVEKARQRRSKDEAAQVLGEARRLYDKGDYAAAEKAALRAKTLHGPYNIWDLGDRPDKVLADCQAAREKKQKPNLPPAPLVARNTRPAGPQQPAGNGANHLPDPAASPVLEMRARQMLGEARVALQNGDPVKARLLADQVRDMHVALNRPGDDSPEAVYRAIEQSRRPGGPAGVVPASATASARPQPAPDAPPAGADPRARAQALMAEARQLLHDNKLLEARQKALEAQRTGATFGPNEEGPEVICQQAAYRAHVAVDGLMARASEMVRYGREDPQTRLQKAEQELLTARQLAAAFGQDVQPVDRSLAWVRQQRGGSMPPAGVEASEAVARVPAQPAGGPSGMLPPPGSAGTSGGQGAELLSKARLELRNGNTPVARRLAEDACQPRYGVRDEALAVLRSIDVEEFNQKRLAANRTFDAALAAYRRHDFNQSVSLIGTIDTRLLDDDRRVRLRDVMSMPEMQPAASGQLAQAGGPAVGAPPRGVGTPPAPASTLGPDAGRATARDDPDKALLQRTRAMAEVRFQAARREGMEIQSAAAEKFRSGQQEAAIAMLDDYLSRLQDAQLEPGQFTLLRRPVESRLQQFKLLRAQEEFTNRKSAATRAHNEHKEGELAEQNKQKHVSELMKQFNALYKEGKYLEAENMASRAHELDPDNSVVAAAIQMARVQAHRDLHNKNKNEREEFAFNGYEDAEKVGDPYAIDHGIAFNKEAAERARNRSGGKYDGTSYSAPRKNEKERDIERKLNTPVTLNFTDAPLKTVIEDLRNWQGINIYVDDAALSESAVSLDRPVTVKLDQVSLKSALKLLLQPLHLTYIIQDEVLQITTEGHAKGGLKTTTYQVADLVIPVENYGAVGGAPPAFLGTPTTSSGQYTPTPVTGAMSLTGGTPVGAPTGSSSSQAGGSPFASAGTSSNGGVQVARKQTTTNEEVLIKLITNTIQPRSWAEMGGPGTIDYFPLTMALVINQTPDIQDQIQDLLQALRRLQDQEVAVEVRFISLSDDFFERIGVNFNLNIINKHNGTRLEPALNTGQFTPDSFINVFQPNNFLSGLQASGSLTPDLNIPVNVQSFAAAVPPFGGYNSSGLTMGIAYLSDIQVFLFMEAAQGDVRTNIMQAPKLSLFNGQTATLSVFDHQLFTTGVAVTPQMGLFTFQPQSVQFPLGVQLTMQAVISADRRFVRMSLAPTLTNLASPNVQLFPIVVPIFPLFNGTGTGQPVVFTQFIQQPLVSVVSVLTTVAVPDGGTVLMGGIKRLSEGRTEYGPPVLSKIPYVNRLFKNVGYGRDTESLLIMVTPRIIIQAEEEERQTGVVIPPAVIP